MSVNKTASVQLRGVIEVGAHWILRTQTIGQKRIRRSSEVRQRDLNAGMAITDGEVTICVKPVALWRTTLDSILS